MNISPSTQIQQKVFFMINFTDFFQSLEHIIFYSLINFCLLPLKSQVFFLRMILQGKYRPLRLSIIFKRFLGEGKDGKEKGINGIFSFLEERGTVGLFMVPNEK